MNRKLLEPQSTEHNDGHGGLFKNCVYLTQVAKNSKALSLYILIRALTNS